MVTPDVAQASRLHGLGIGHPFLVPRRCLGTGYRERGFCDTFPGSGGDAARRSSVLGLGSRAAKLLLGAGRTDPARPSSCADIECVDRLENSLYHAALHK